MEGALRAERPYDDCYLGESSSFQLLAGFLFNLGFRVCDKRMKTSFLECKHYVWCPSLLATFMERFSI